MQFRQSKQRSRILELLRSTGTVYRNLSTLIDQGLVKKIHFGSTFDRFEANTKPHYHLICESCGNIFDFDMAIYEDLNDQAKKLTTFTINYHKLDFYGICQDCRQSEQ